MDEDLALVLLAFFVIAVPVMAFSARFAIKPIVDAIIRLREASLSQPNQLPQERRLAAIEAELTAIRDQLERLEGTAFLKELRSGNEEK